MSSTYPKPIKALSLNNLLFYTLYIRDRFSASSEAMEEIQMQIDDVAEGDPNLGNGSSAPMVPMLCTPPCAKRAVATPQQSAATCQSAADLHQSEQPSQSQKLDGNDGELVSLDMLLATKEAVTQAPWAGDKPHGKDRDVRWWLRCGTMWASCCRRSTTFATSLAAAFQPGFPKPLWWWGASDQVSERGRPWSGLRGQHQDCRWVSATDRARIQCRGLVMELQPLALVLKRKFRMMFVVWVTLLASRLPSLRQARGKQGEDEEVIQAPFPVESSPEAEPAPDTSNPCPEPKPEKSKTARKRPGRHKGRQ